MIPGTLVWDPSILSCVLTVPNAGPMFSIFCFFPNKTVYFEFLLKIINSLISPDLLVTETTISVMVMNHLWVEADNLKFCHPDLRLFVIFPENRPCPPYIILSSLVRITCNQDEITKCSFPLCISFSLASKIQYV